MKDLSKETRDVLKTCGLKLRINRRRGEYKASLTLRSGRNYFFSFGMDGDDEQDGTALKTAVIAQKAKNIIISTPDKGDREEVIRTISALRKALGINGAYSDGSCDHNNLTGKYTLYADGGCISNPGGRGGYGTVLINNGTGCIQEFSGGEQSSTNNRMEIMAVIAGMREIPAGSVVDVYSDSQYVINTMGGYYAKKKNFDLWNLLDDACRGKKVHPHWIRGHSGNKYNERCDRLASLAMGEKIITSLAGLSPEEVVPDCPEMYEGERKTVKESCQKTIASLNRSRNPKFADYLKLKVGGRDGWSSVSFEKMKEYLPPDTLAHFLARLADDKELAGKALRWYCRGMERDKAIRKASVDVEVAKNCFNARRRNEWDDYDDEK